MGFQDLIVFKKAFALAMRIFNVSKLFPKEEIYSLTDHLRRSSRSVCANIAEAYRKRAYVKYFFSKLTDCDGENSETQVWITFALQCNYISKMEYDELIAESEEVGKLLQYMMQNPTKFGVRSD